MDEKNTNFTQFKLPLNTLPDRLDKVLAQLMPDYSRSRLQSWIESGHVLVNGQQGKIRTRVGPAAVIQVWPQPAPEDLAFKPEPIDLNIVAQSPDWIVIDKPQGLVTHPGAGNWQGTLLNGLLYHFPELSRVPRAGIVHRLDKDTSGLLVVARNLVAQTSFVRQLQEHTVKRKYRALIHGWLESDQQYSDPIGRDARVPVRMSANHPLAPKNAITDVYLKNHGSFGNQPVSDIVCQLQTGRTHQIRVHLSQHQHPLLGDTLYGGKIMAQAERQMLHAIELAFDDPVSGERLGFNSDLATDFQMVLDNIEWQ